ncbi:hypothetical protein [Nocardia brasiliensis]|uniref:hypothetical protein n=1 Tax=Nocardia brasiliensis TaxID=37326 RepID=UPI0018947F13|nr:hypothetical protein [Nocardia brasiliensis]MBF6546976.1 hypothetical protein [Nocardia brasiliensis]
MNEKYPGPQPNPGEQPDERTEAVPSAESDSACEQQLVWEVGDVLLRTVYDAVEHPFEDNPQAVASLALTIVQVTHSFDLSSDTGKHALGVRARYVADKIAALVRAYDELTTSDLQGSVDALAFTLVRNMLPVDDTERTDGGDHE